MKPRVIYQRLCILLVVALPVVPQAVTADTDNFLQHQVTESTLLKVKSDNKAKQAADTQSDHAGSSMVIDTTQPVIEEREDDCE